jgi:hypothetical protein
MAIQKVPRDPENLEMLRLYAALDPVQAVGTGLRDAARLDEFVQRARASLGRSVGTPSRVQGLRAQALFRATLVALGQFRLLVEEDAGDPYYDDKAGRVSPPDLRVVDRDGKTLLIEVKSVRLNDPLKPFRLRAADVEAWRSWGELTGAPVALALWWAAPGQWTLTSLDRLRPRGAKFEIDLIDAMVANEMSRFGDCMLGTRPPLIFRLHVKQEGAVDPETSRAPVRVTDVDLLAGGRMLEDELERRIAFYFLRFGKWEVEQELQFGPGGDVVTVDLVARPPVVEDGAQAAQDFASVGMLSSLYAALFDEVTLSADGEVDQLDHRPEPGELSKLIPDDFWDRADRALPLWRVNIEPVDPDTIARG